MEPLRKQKNSGDPNVAWAAELMGSFPPLDGTSATKLQNQVQAKLATSARPFYARPGALFGAGLAALTLVAVGAGLSVGHRRAASAVVAPPASAAPPSQDRASERGAGDVVPPTANMSPPTTSVALPTANSTAPPTAKTSGKLTHSVVRGRSADEADVARTADAPSSEEFAALVAAVKALRSDHDPGRAGVLSAEYLQRYPHGALAEEALELAMESAQARHDPQTATFAKRYLTRFPEGRYREMARRLLPSRQP